MLWVGTAAIPLRNVTWVDAYRVKPDWGRALLRFLTIVIVGALVGAVAEGGAQVAVNGGVFRVIVAIGLVVVLVALFGSAKPVLVVEMASGSKVVVTLPNMDDLRQIAGQIVSAIDNPKAEFTAIVRQLNNTNNYGPVVNMSGGRGNTGFKL